jgi:hypothetical protein
MRRSARELSAPLRLGLFGAGLAAVFGVAVLVGQLVVPPDAVVAWAEQGQPEGEAHEGDGRVAETHGGAEHAAGTSPAEVPGLSIEADGYRFADVTTPVAAGEPGEVRFRIIGPDARPVTGFEITHEKPLHLIVVRTDGTSFRHVHPKLASDGTWTMPWTWDDAGSFRLFADFRPADHDRTLTLTSTATVTGDVQPGDVPVSGELVAVAGPFTVELAGELAPGAASDLTFTVLRDGVPVTTIEPYLGAAGHLVMLRAGDLGYLHVHPLDEAETKGADGLGPDIRFGATPPTPGAYFLYLDFQVDGQVYTARFAANAGH